MFKESVKCVFKKIPRVFQECFKEVLFCNFVVAWISSQLHEQREGLFLCLYEKFVFDFKLSVTGTHLPNFCPIYNLVALVVLKMLKIELNCQHTLLLLF